MDAVQGRVVSRLAHVDIEGLTVRYGSVTALDQLDLAIAGGEMFVLLGGSGSGKTTLLRALGGFIRPTAGRIGLAGQDITRLPPHRRPVNTTFQSYALFPHMSVADNVGFGLRRQGVDRTEIAARVQWSGAGIDLRSGRPAPTEVATAVRSILATPSFAAAAGRLQAEIAEHRPFDEIAVQIDELV